MALVLKKAECKAKMAITKLIGSYKKALVTNIRPKKLEKNAIFHDAVKRSRSTVNVFVKIFFGNKTTLSAG